MATMRTSTARQVVEFELPDGSNAERYVLRPDEQTLLTQLIYNAHGGNPDLRRLFYYHRPSIEKWLGYAMFQRGQSFTGTRTSGSSIAGCVLHPQHLASVASAATNINIGGWKCQLMSRTGKGYTYRTQAAEATGIFDKATIADDIWPCILGISTDLNHATTAYAVEATQILVTGVRYTVSGRTTLPLPIYSTTSHALSTTTPITYTPFIMVSEADIFTEELYATATVAANATSFNLRIIGLTFGVGSKLAAL